MVYAVAGESDEKICWMFNTMEKPQGPGAVRMGKMSRPTFADKDDELLGKVSSLRNCTIFKHPRPCRETASAGCRLANDV